MIKYTISIFLTLSVFIHTVEAQSNLMLHRLSDIPQRNMTNPALFFNGSVSVGLPLISNTGLSVSNSAFRYSDLVRRSSDDSLYIDSENMLSKLSNSNNLDLTAETDLMHAGFKFKKGYIGFSITEKLNIHLAYPKEFLEFLIRGNGAYIGQKADLALELLMEHRRDYALTYAMELSRKLTAGVRLKRLYGMENITVEKARASIYTHPQTLEITSTPEIMINTSGIESNTFNDFVMKQYLFGRNNTGWAMDIGIVSKINDKWTVSVSFNDFGSITWNSLTDNYQSDQSASEFTYSGIDLNQFLDNTGEAGSTFQTMLDSLSDGLNIEHTHKSYKLKIPFQNFTSINYQINDKHAASLLLHFIQYKDQLQLMTSVQHEWKPLKWLNIVSGFSIINKNLVNPGLGICISLADYQFFAISDNIYGALSPQNSRNADIRVGINFIIGRNSKTVVKQENLVESTPLENLN
ncbi:MAG: DUF5723 family protein [Bacteroidia bacterium]|nr:hypothetical protein [Bacteroidia bacterium]MCZ2277693.1 DUF5723 family protein [Bacteroidia bacterium]